MRRTAFVYQSNFLHRRCYLNKQAQVLISDMCCCAVVLFWKDAAYDLFVLICFVVCVLCKFCLIMWLWYGGAKTIVLDLCCSFGIYLLRSWRHRSGATCVGIFRNARWWVSTVTYLHSDLHWPIQISTYLWNLKITYCLCLGTKLVLYPCFKMYFHHTFIYCKYLDV